MSTISSDDLRAILAGTVGVTPGPWWGEPHYDEMERGCAVIAATPHGPLPGNPTRGMLAFAVQVDPANAKVAEADAAHIARLDPQTVASIITELLSLRESHPIEDGEGEGLIHSDEVYREAVLTVEEARAANHLDEENGVWINYGARVTMERLRRERRVIPASLSNPGTSKVENSRST